MMIIKKAVNGAVVLIMLLLIGGAFYSYVEGWRFIDSLYFSAMTITTIGYGDFTPKTDIGKMFTIVFAIIGVAAWFYLAAAVGKAILFKSQNNRNKKW